MSNPEAPGRDLAIDAPEGMRSFRAYLADVSKRKRLVVTVWLAVFASVGAWTTRQPNEYETAATIEYDPNPSQPLGSRVDDFSAGGAFWMSQEFYQTQNQILTSQQLAERVVRRLSLNRDAGFVAGEANRRDRVSITVEEAGAILRSRVRVEPVADTRLVRVVVTDQSPRRAQAVANAIVESYVEKTLDDRLGSTVEALNWLSDQLDSAQEDLQQSELALHAFKHEHNVLSVSMEDRQNFVANQIEGYTAALTASRTRRIELSARARELRAAVARDPLAVNVEMVDSNTEVQGLRAAYREKFAERQSLAVRYGESHPQMQALSSELETIMTELRRAIEGILRRAEADLREVERIEGGLAGALENANQDGLNLNLQEIEYLRLSRERENNEKLYNMLLERTAEANLARLLRVTHVRLVDPALKPSAPVRPRFVVNMVGGFAGGLLLGVALAVIAGLLDRTVKSAGDIEMLGVPVLGILPFAEDEAQQGKRSRRRARQTSASASGPELYVHEHPRSVVAECCRTIRTNLAFMGAADELRTLVITSAGPSEGKTTTSLSIATAIAQGGAKTLIVDTDMRRPRLHKILGVGSDRGVTSVLIGDANIDECIYETVVPGLYVLPCGPIPPNPSELLHTPRFAQLLTELEARFQRVILDSPPIGVVTDAAVIAPQVDGVLWVARAGVAHRDAVARAMRQVRDVGGRLVGAVVNALEAGHQHYGSAYYSYYQRSGYYVESPEPTKS